MSDLILWSIVLGIVSTVPCALLGCYLVLRRQSLLGDAVTHSVLPGIVLGVLLVGRIEIWAIVLGATLFGVLTAVLTEAVRDWTRISEDAGMGVVFTTLFALGVVVSAIWLPRAHLDDCILQGDLTTIILPRTVWFGWSVPYVLPMMLVMLALTLAFIVVLWKELKIAAFDTELAQAMGLRPQLVHYLFMALVAAVTVTAFQTIGSVLVIARLIVPAATAHLLTDRLAGMLVLATLVAVSASVAGGLLASTAVLNTNVAATLVLLAGVQFTLAVLFAPRHGVLARQLRQWRLGLRIVQEDVLARLYKQEEAHKAGEPAAAARLVQEGLRVATGLKGWWARRWLRRQGLLDAQAHLTDAGRQVGARIVRAHRLWEAYLGANFDLPLDHLHDPAERMEHYLDPELQQALALELQQPATDPHGRTIPEGKPPG